MAPKLYKPKLMRMQHWMQFETKLYGADHAAKQVLRASLLMLSMWLCTRNPWW
jgi:hypothetical protein